MHSRLGTSSLCGIRHILAALPLCGASSAQAVGVVSQQRTVSIQILEIESLWLEGEYPYPPFFPPPAKTTWTAVVSLAQSAPDSSPFSALLNDPGYPATAVEQQSTLGIPLQAIGSINGIANSSTGSPEPPYGFSTEEEEHTLDSALETTFLLEHPIYLEIDARVAAESSLERRQTTLEARVRLTDEDSRDLIHVIVYCDYSFGCRDYKWSEVYEFPHEVPPGQEIEADSEASELMLLPVGRYTLSAYANGDIESICSWVGGPTGYYQCRPAGGDASFEVTLADSGLPIPLLPRTGSGVLAAALVTAASLQLYRNRGRLGRHWRPRQDSNLGRTV